MDACKLSNRQQQVYNAIARGITEAQSIAEELGISRQTAQMHRGLLMRKLGVKTKGALILYVARHPELVMEPVE